MQGHAAREQPVSEPPPLDWTGFSIDGLISNWFRPPEWIRRIETTVETRRLKPSDIPLLKERDHSKEMLREFNALLVPGRPYAELLCILRMFSRELSFVVLIGILGTTLELVCAIVLRITLVELQNIDSGASIHTAAFFAFLFSVAIIAGYNVRYVRYIRKSVVFSKIRNLLTIIIYEKALRLSPLEYQSYDESKITVLIMSDIERLLTPGVVVSTFSSILLPMAAVISFEFDVIGIAAVVYACTILVSIVVFAGLLAYKSKSSSPQLGAANFRIGLLRELIKNIHIVKFYGWEKPLARVLDVYHEFEQKSLRLSQAMSSIGVVLHRMLGPISSCLAFMLYISSDMELTADRVFSSLLLIPVMFKSVTDTIEVFASTANSIKSAQQISEFFMARELTPMLKVLPKRERLLYKIRNCKIEWPGKLVAENLNIDIPKGSLIVISGQVGSGKSTLLMALMGMASQTPGAIRFRRGARYASVMKSWIQGGSVRDNIVFGGEWDATRYEWVIAATCLDVDIASFPDGDLTEVGDGGVTLSGGARTRISLARCLYTDANVFILDDVLAAVDGQVARHILQKLKGLIEKSKTVILSSNDYWSVSSADKVLFLEGDGRYLYGTYEKLLQNKKFSEAVLSAVSVPGLDTDSEDETDGRLDVRNGSRQQHAVSEVDTRTLDPVIRIAHEVVPEDRAQRAVRDYDLETVRSSYVSHREREASTRSDQSLASDASSPPHSAMFSLVNYDDPFEANHLMDGLRRLWKVLHVIAPRSGRMLTISSILFSSQSLLTAVLPLLLCNLVNTKASPAVGFTKLMYLLCAAIAVPAVALPPSHILKTIAFNRIVQGINREATFSLFQAPMSFYESVPLGRLMTRFVVDMDMVNGDLRGFSLPGVLSFSEIVIYVSVIAFLDPILGVPFAGLMFWRMWSWWNFPVSVMESVRLKKLFDSRAMNKIMEDVNGLSTFVSYGQQEHVIASLNEALDNRQASYSTSLLLHRSSFFDTVRKTAPLSMVMPVAVLYSSRMRQSPGNFGLLLFSLERLYANSYDLLGTLSYLWGAFESATRLEELVTALPRESYSSALNVPSKWRALKGEIEFRNTFFQYRKRLPFVLNDFNLSVRGGEKIGICGRTGAGKSTIFNALFRFADLRKGQILIDGQDISQLNVDELRKSLAVIPQNNVLFRGTIRSNLDPVHEFDDAVLWEALRKSGFCEATKKRPFHLDYKVEAEGSNFSLGEQQLIALARALVRQCKIILLDEATAAVDYETDRRVQSTIQQEFGSCTVLCIAHRIQTIVNYDRILALGMGGRSMEFGRPKELYDRRKIFWEICEDAGVEESDFM